MLNERADGAAVQSAVALSARRPNGRSLTPVQHPKLQRRQIRRPAHDAAEGIDLADDRALSDTADRRVARHLPDGLECACDECDTGTEARRRDGGFGPRMASPDDDDVEIGFGGGIHTEE
ncbi:MAG: hypothetical protein NVS4B3_01660 [Gemmatimonadaceae bacterium]